MNKEEILNRFYATQLERDFTTLISDKNKNGVILTQQHINEYFHRNDEYKSMLIELLTESGYWK